MQTVQIHLNDHPRARTPPHATHEACSTLPFTRAQPVFTDPPNLVIPALAAGISSDSAMQMGGRVRICRITTHAGLGKTPAASAGVTGLGGGGGCVTNEPPWGVTDRQLQE